MTALAEFEGHDVAQTTIRVTKAGDGLSAALSVAPVEFDLEDEVYIVLRTSCVRVSHEPIKDTGVLRRVHTLAAIEGTIVKQSLVDKVLQEQRVAIEQAAGVHRLELDEDE